MAAQIDELVKDNFCLELIPFITMFIKVIDMLSGKKVASFSTFEGQGYHQKFLRGISAIVVGFVTSIISSTDIREVKVLNGCVRD